MIASRDKRSLAPKLAEVLADRDGPLPVWVRAPRDGSVEYFSGLGRNKLYDLASEGLIRTVSLREPGHIQGTRLFHLRSILEYLERCELSAELAGKEKGAATLEAAPVETKQAGP